MNKFEEAIECANDNEMIVSNNHNWSENQITYDEYSATNINTQNILKALELGKELQNENLILKTKIKMYEELDKEYRNCINVMGERFGEYYISTKLNEIKNKIKELENERTIK